MGLLFRGRRYQHVAVVDLGDALRNALQRLPCGLSQGLRVAGQGAAVAHGPHGLIGAGLDTADHGFDFAGGRLGSGSQRPHFVCHHRKAATLLTCTRSLDGGVEGQQIGLLGDPTDHVQYLPDLTDAPGELFDHGGRTADLGTDGIDRIHRIAGLITTGSRVGAGLSGRFRRRHGVTRDLFDRSGHLVHSRSGLLNLIVLTYQTATAFFSHGIQLFSSRGQLVGSAGYLPDRAFQVVLHIAQGNQHHASFVVILADNRQGQVTACNSPGIGHRSVDWRADGTTDEQAHHKRSKE